mgnify:CR=1 FL=1
MAAIEISFRPDMREAIVAGRKCCTSRTSCKGRPGDTFAIGTRQYRLTAVRRHPLHYVASVLYKDEGVDSPAEFGALWAEIYPVRGCDPFQLVWVHHFEEVA